VKEPDLMSVKLPIKLLFEEAAQECFKPSKARIQKLKAWVEQANSARRTGNLEAFQNQYDKAEELITFYTFAPLVLSLNKVGLTNRILGLAGVSPLEENVVSLGLERQYPPPTGYLSWVEKDVKNHPVKYIREQAGKHSTKNEPLESRTHVDAFIETDKLLIFFEIKFTSDITYNTTFNPIRNQLARLIDVGLNAVKYSGKEVLVLLSSPSKFYESKSRLYYYKIQDYSSPSIIQKDVAWRSIGEIQDNLLAVKWIALEDLINLLYKDFKHPEKVEAIEFFRERKLI
jgi:hypothetical protein